MSNKKVIYITDRDDRGVLLGCLIGISDDDPLYEVRLAPDLVVVSHDGQSRFDGADQQVSVKWQPTTDDEFPGVPAAEGVYEAMQEFEAGQSEVSGYAEEDEDRKVFSVVVSQGPQDTVGVYVNWATQEVITAWRVEEVTDAAASS